MTYPANLDFSCAREAERLFERLKSNDKALNHVQRSLGILQEDGLYAFAVYQEYRASRGGADIKQACRTLLTTEPIASLCLPEPPPEFLAFCRALGEQSLDRLFLARDLILRVLVYTYYHLRTHDKNRSAGAGRGA